MDILLVDDNQDIIRFVSQILELEGHRVDIARDGLEALQRAANRRPHAVVLDVNMPRMEGFDVCRRLKELYNNVPVMMLTVHAEKADLQKGADAGADAYLPKPFDIETFITYLTAMLGLRYGAARGDAAR